MAGGLAVAGHEGGKEALRWATGKTIVRPQEATWQGAEEKEKGQTGTMDAGRGERQGSECRADKFERTGLLPKEITLHMRDSDTLLAATSGRNTMILTCLQTLRV